MTQTDTDVRIVTGEEPSADDMEAIEWGREVIRREPQVLQDGLRQMVTLTVALVGGSTALLGQLRMPLWCKGAGAVLLLLALACALVGSLPYRVRYDEESVQQCQRARERGIRYKTAPLWGAATFLLLAFVFFILGLLLA